MTTRIRRILVAIGDEARAPRRELVKAAAIARASGARIELFHAMTEVDPGVSYPETVTVQMVRLRRAALAAPHQRRLERLAHDPLLRGIKVTCTTEWDYPPHEAVVRRAARTGADLVVAAARDHRFGARLLLRNTDWELIRHCPVPVLLVKSSRAWQRPRIVAAIDPFHTHARPADLDARLLEAGNAYARLFKGQLHVFHAFMPLISLEPSPMAIPQEVQELHSRQVARMVGKFAASAHVPVVRRHVCLGEVADELQNLTQKIHARLIVMGAVSRSAIKRAFIGDAAERVLDRLECDVLVVKPRGFKSKVPRTAKEARV